ncbi:MAG TPA: hypothetical protein VK428_00170 [Acidimicrobiales bacterium]|nr:hypothetical protein [Acidimicrobiales bacterium]
MHTPNRAAPHVLLALLVLLGLGAFLLSLSFAPSDAGQQLRTAAANTAAASSFVLTDTETAGPLAPSGSRPVANEERAVIVYRSPDAVRETVTEGGRTASVLVVGNSRYERVGNGKWYDLGAPLAVSGSASVGSQAVQAILFPWQSLSSATHVTTSHGVYGFVPGQRSLLLSRLLGTTGGSTSFAATVGNEFVRSEQLLLRASGEQVTVTLDLSRVDRAPSLSAPAASQLTTVPPAS